MSYALHKSRAPDKLPVFKPIGRVWNLTSPRVEFINHRYQSSQQGQHSHSSTDQQVQQCRLSSYDQSLLNNVRYLSITITQTAGGKIPVIKLLKIIGRPSDPRYIRVCHSAAAPTHNHQEVINRDLQGQQVIAEEPIRASIRQDIPTEFLDALTNDIMSLPVILPSGYIIDQSSLDKHVEAERVWGRQPSDPFTGVPFNDRRKPVINQKLKERIDHYVLINNISAPRAVGLKRPIEKYRDTDASCGTPPSDDPPSKKLRSCDPASTAPNNEKLSSLDNMSPNDGHSKGTLAQRLNKLLKKSSNYRVVTLPNDKVLSRCSHCDGSDPQYKLECKHLLCRACATQNSAVTHICSVCKTSTPSNLITRYHPTGT